MKKFNWNELSKEEQEELEREAKERYDEKAVILYKHENGVRTCQLVHAETEEDCQKLIEKYVGKDGIRGEAHGINPWDTLWHSKGGERGTLPWNYVEYENEVRTVYTSLDGNVVLTSEEVEGHPTPLSFREIEEIIYSSSLTGDMPLSEFGRRIICYGQAVTY